MFLNWLYIIDHSSIIEYIAVYDSTMKYIIGHMLYEIVHLGIIIYIMV
jgi:hypothetical protein